MNIKLGSFAVGNQNAEDIRHYVKRTQHIIYNLVYDIAVY